MRPVHGFEHPISGKWLQVPSYREALDQQYKKRNLPAKRMRTFEYWRNLGEVSALNGFDIEIVLHLNRYR